MALSTTLNFALSPGSQSFAGDVPDRDPCGIRLMTSGYAVATLVVFILSIFFVIHPVSIHTPRPIPRIPINLTTAPIFAIALLWAARCLDLAVIRDGVVGTEGVKPYNILILFFSLTYMAITLDITGILQAAAFWLCNSCGRNGWKLYLYIYIMLTLLSVLLGNDPVILSGTAFLVYYTKAAELDPRAWVMAEFAAANTASMVLFVGNPTNIVICEGFNINIATFTAYTILPFLACNVCCFVALAFQYRNQVPRELSLRARRDPRSALLDPVGALVGSFMLGAMLVICLVVSFFGIEVWMISGSFAVGKFLFDLGWDHYRYSHGIPMLGRHNPALDRSRPVTDPDRIPMLVRGISILGHGISVLGHGISMLCHGISMPCRDTSTSGRSRETFQGPAVVEGQRMQDTSADQRLEDTSPYSPSPEQPRSHLPRTGSFPEVSKIIPADQRLEDTSPYPPSLDEDYPRYPLQRADVVQSCPGTPKLTSADHCPEDTPGRPPLPEREQSRFPPLVAGSAVQPSPIIPKIKLNIDIPPEGATEMSYCSSFADTKRPPSFPFDEEISIGSHPEMPMPQIELTAESKHPVLPVLRWHRSLHDRLHRHFPTFMTALPRLPFALIPFAFSQFILIEALNRQGWVKVFADWLVRASGNQLHPIIWLTGVICVILCNLLGTNIGATILLTKVVRAAALPHDANRAAAVALAVASNIGAISFTFSASLAGLLWRAILMQKGIHVRQRDFAFWNLLPLLVMTSVGLGVVSAQMAVLFQSP